MSPDPEEPIVCILVPFTGSADAEFDPNKGVSMCGRDPFNRARVGGPNCPDCLAIAAAWEVHGS